MSMSSSRMRSFLVWSLAGFFGWAIVALTPGCGNTCQSTSDCAAGLLCLDNPSGAGKTCQPKPDGVTNQEIPGTPEFDDGGGNDDTNPPPDRRDPPSDDPPGENPPGENPPGENPGDTTDSPTPTGKAPVKGDLIINEIHADPKSGDGDANGDGTTSSSQDEFIEFVNTTDGDIDLSGVVLATDKTIMTFAVGTTLPAKTAVVVFGGGLDGDTEINTGKPHSKFGGALVYTKSVSLTNSGKKVVLNDKDGGELDAFGYGNAGTDCPGDKDQSVTRWPDMMSGTCKLHSEAGTSAAPFSPGTRVDGGKFSDPAPEPIPEPTPEVPADGGEMITPDTPTDTPPTDNPPADNPPADTTPDTPTGPAPQAGELVLNELHTDPDTANGDANGDGTVSSSQDEFVEIVNVSNKTLQVGGVEFHFKGAARYTLKPLLLPPNGVIVIFDGGLANDTEVNTGMPHSKFGGAYVYTGGIGSLNNTGTQIAELKTAAGTQISKFEYGSGTCKGDQNQSLTLSPDLTGTCTLHSTAQTGVLFSPGTKTDGSKF